MFRDERTCSFAACLSPSYARNAVRARNVMSFRQAGHAALRRQLVDFAYNLFKHSKIHPLCP